MQRKWWIQFSIQAVLFLVGAGGMLVPEIRTWWFAGILWGIAFIWAIVTLIMWIKSRKSDEQEGTNEIADIKQIPILLQEIHEHQKHLVENKKVNIKTIRDVEKISPIIGAALPILGLDKIPSFKHQDPHEIQEKIPVSVLKKLTSPQTSIPLLMQIGGVMDYRKMGLEKLRDSQYRRIKNRLEKCCALAYTDDSLTKLKTDYLESSYATNSFTLFFKYWVQLANKFKADSDIDVISPSQSSWLGLIPQGIERVMNHKLEGVKQRMEQIIQGKASTN